MTYIRGLHHSAKFAAYEAYFDAEEDEPIQLRLSSLAQLGDRIVTYTTMVNDILDYRRSLNLDFDVRQFVYTERWLEFAYYQISLMNRELNRRCLILPL